MIIVTHGDEAERLQHSVGGAGRIQHLRHPMHRAALRLECDFDEVTLAKGFCDAQKTSGDGNGLQFAFGTLAVFHHDQGCDGTAKVNARSVMDASKIVATRGAIEKLQEVLA